MKFILTTLIVFIAQCTFGQNKFCTITEQFSAMGNTTLDKLIITDPSGKTTTQDITHFLKNISAHDFEFLKVLNDFVQQGYDITNPNPLAHGDMIGGVSIFTRTWFLKKQ
jgi:hypothetical protein